VDDPAVVAKRLVELAKKHIEDQHSRIGRATGVAIPYFDAGLASARQKGWRTYEVPCGHDVMLDMPERLVEILQEAA
jgi:hypothetical protein